MRTRAPFTVIPWREDFLKGLLDLVLADSGDDVGKAVFIFPHGRPQRYLSLLLRKDQRLSRPLLMPRTHTVSGLFTALSGRILARPARNAELLDRVGLLLACVREETGGASANSSPFLTDARLFFPWGVRLASLYEECFSQFRKPHDFLHMEGQVSPFAEMLLSHLGGIFIRYEAALRQREWTTPGFDASLVADYLKKNDELPEGVLPGGRPLYIAGFHALTGTEQVLFRHLWERRGARIVIHADPALAGAQDCRSHWSCSAFIDWAASWHATLSPAPGCGPPRPGRKGAPSEVGQRIRYFQGFDLHSQLAVIENELADMAAPEKDAPRASGAFTEKSPDTGTLADDHAADTVIVLPDSSLLMPVLHHLPGTDINVSMGYPLSRSPLFRLVDTLARLQEGRKDTGYYWRDLVDLIRHPYLKMLSPAGEDDASPPIEEWPGMLLRGELHRLERELRDSGGRFTDLRTLVLEYYRTLTPQELPPATVLGLLDDLFRTVFTAFENLHSLKGLAAALKGLCSLMLRYGADLWRRFPIDAECLYRLHHSLIPALEFSELSDEIFPPETLFAILRSLLGAERVPFEADPLVGLQVMGMLETRLLSFRRVIVIGAEEAFLPGSSVGDPLLPEALRPELGLPPLQTREQVSAYTFFRLIAGAEETLLLWREGGDSGIAEQKTRRSRFVEELLWREEKRGKRLLAGQGRDGPLSVISTAIAPIVREQPGIPVTPAMRRLLDGLLAQPVSASLLDAYLRCPVRFYYERAARLSPQEEVREGDDPLAIGELFHQVLQDAYATRLNRLLPGGEELVRAAGEDLLAALESSPGYRALARRLPADAFAMLACAGKKRLADYLLRQPPTTVLATETPLQAAFGSCSPACTLTGKLDRIDERPLPEDAGKGIVILDYKTGRLPHVDASVWDDEELWRPLRAWRPDHDDSRLLDALAERMESVQLPFYLLLYSLAADQGRLPQELKLRPLPPAWDAAWVSLGSTGEEVSLFKKIPWEARRRILENRSVLLVDFLLRHIRESRTLFPRTGPHCGWCSCEKLCKIFPASG